MDVFTQITEQVVNFSIPVHWIAGGVVALIATTKIVKAAKRDWEVTNRKNTIRGFVHSSFALGQDYEVQFRRPEAWSSNHKLQHVYYGKRGDFEDMTLWGELIDESLPGEKDWEVWHTINGKEKTLVSEGQSHDGAKRIAIVEIKKLLKLKTEPRRHSGSLSNPYDPNF